MSFQTVLSIVGVAFTAFELYQRFRQKSVLEVPKVRFLLEPEPKHSEVSRSKARSGESEAELRESRAKHRLAKRNGRSAVSSKIGMA